MAEVKNQPQASSGQNKDDVQILSSNAQPDMSAKKRKLEEGEGGSRQVGEGGSQNTFLHLCLRTKAEEFAIDGPAKETPIFVCYRQDKITEVWKGLIQHNFLSVPVLLDNDEKKYYGMLDQVDIVRYVIRHFGEEKMSGDRDFWDIVKEEEQFLQKTVGEIMQYPYSSRNPFHPVVRGYSALAVIEPLAREKGLYRIPVIDSLANRKILNMVTQSQVVKWLHANRALVGAKLQKPIKICKGGQFLKRVIAVHEDQTAISAFNLMVDQQISGVAVVNESGRLRGVLSLRDLKAIGHDARLFWRLFQTVKNFIQKLKLDASEKNLRPRVAVTALPDDDLGSVIAKLAEHSIHRVIVVDNHQDKKPIGLVSLKDVLLETITVD